MLLHRNDKKKILKQKYGYPVRNSNKVWKSTLGITQSHLSYAHQGYCKISKKQDKEKVIFAKSENYHNIGFENPAKKTN